MLLVLGFIRTTSYYYFEYFSLTSNFYSFTQAFIHSFNFVLGVKVFYLWRCNASCFGIY